MVQWSENILPVVTCDQSMVTKPYERVIPLQISMNIVFFGDSLTLGTVGISYIEKMQQQISNYHLINKGKNGDTVKSLHNRLQRTVTDNHYDIGFLWIGANDIIVHIGLTFPLIKMMNLQPWAKTMNDFQEIYLQLVAFLKSHVDHLFLVPPLLIGENIQNQWNKLITKQATIMKTISKQEKHLTFVDIHKELWTELQQRKTSQFLRDTTTGFLLDSFQYHTPQEIDQIARKRGLLYTFDGVHLNSYGAQRVADVFLNYLQDHLR